MESWIWIYGGARSRINPRPIQYNSAQLSSGTGASGTGARARAGTGAGAGASRTEASGTGAGTGAGAEASGTGASGTEASGVNMPNRVQQLLAILKEHLLQVCPDNIIKLPAPQARKKT